ncbi:MAG: FAD-dependent thymidylate synthase [Deltaproteobacteria bacterium]|nr:FAD-dependent thymidylate synthase [Deltaproteobacteria bacterium]
MPPEKAAYALARYSRSPDSIESSLRWVFDHSAEKFWEQFYFDYGHASIADLGHAVVCFEDISELAAIHVEDERLWDGQAKSSRYQDFARLGYHLPPELSAEEAARYRAGANALFAAYRELFPPVERRLREKHPRPADMKEGLYARNVAARAFDVVRYVLPLAVPTNVGQVVSIRTLEKQIGHLLAAPYPEVQDLGERLKAAAAAPPLDLWNRLGASAAPAPREPLAATLARHARANEYWRRAYRVLEQIGAEELRLGTPEPAPLVDLVPEQPLEVETVATLLYRVSHHPYRQIAGAVSEWSEAKRRGVLEAALGGREREELLPEFQSGYRLIFDVLMDVGGWRDLHRHRRCQQVRQPFTFAHGYDTPPLLAEAGAEAAYRNAMDVAAAAARGLAPATAAYLVPFGHRVRCLFKMDYAEVEYVSRLRSGVKGHFSYRQVAWEMKRALGARHPFLAERIEATPPWVEDSLRR